MGSRKYTGNQSPSRRLRLRLAMWFAYRVARVPVDVRSSWFVSQNSPKSDRAA